MATNLETGTDQEVLALARPSLKIVGLHIRGLKSIGSLDLPGDGLGWEGPIPDFVMFGGINGSGKTSLLEFLAAAFTAFDHEGGGYSDVLRADEARVDFRLVWPDVIDRTIRFLVGDSGFISGYGEGDWYGFERRTSGPLAPTEILWEADGLVSTKLHGRLFEDESHSRNLGPGVVFFPSERQNFVHKSNYKKPGKLIDSPRFVRRWRPPNEWEDSLEARLYAVRWEDLNARAEGRIDEANGFEAYSRAFDRFFDGRKRLEWHRAELVVMTKSGVTHGLSELSGGEKQVVLFMGELLHRWHPGSLILIDEPELHLHESYQTKLWESLVDWQKERGGQVILATQSGHLFRIAESAMKVLLSRRST